MRLASLVLATSITLGLAARAHAGGGFLPPLQIDVGAASISTRGGNVVGASQWLVGLSWASGYPGDTPVDVGLGIISTSALAADPVAETIRPPIDATGGYFNLAARIDHGPHWRVWLGGRGELMGCDGVGVLGGAVRLSTELWTSARATTRGAGILGTVALAGWAELGARERPDRTVEGIMAAGLGVRVPMMAAGY